MRVLLIAPYYDRNIPGESWSTYKWVEGICARYDTVVLTSHRRGWRSENSPTQARQIVDWVDPKLPHFLRRVDWELKPTYFVFYLQARRWIRQQLKAGAKFDLIHQVNPLALRYPCPAYDVKIPYIIGPLAGSLPTPAGFAKESTDRQWFRKLRQLDQMRIRRDPWLRASYERAALVLGVAPYVKDVLSGLAIARFAEMSETGVERVATTPKQPPAPGEPLKLLFVGRVIRTKGVIDAIRAVALAAPHCHLEFNIVGDGDMLETCKQEAQRLGVGHLVHFHGRLPRGEVTRWYERSHVFLFPSFREPSGNVVFEAMSQGLPLITSTTGGPGYVVTDASGIRVVPGGPQQYAEELGQGILRLARAPDRLAQMSRAALTRVEEIGIWTAKIDRLAEIYAEVVPTQTHCTSH